MGGDYVYDIYYKRRNFYLNLFFFLKKKEEEVRLVLTMNMWNRDLNLVLSYARYQYNQICL